MKSKLVFRILGALASALIIASVFIPFVSVASYSQSLWETHSAVGTLYLPIMIIVFGVIGVLVFSTGFKTELAYASAGGLLFFLIMQTIPIINQGTFNTLGVGYYCLLIGTLLIIIMAFICGLKVKQKVVKESVVEDTKEVSMIDQIDKLYNDQTENQNLNETNSLDNVIQPLPISEVSQMPVHSSTETVNNIEMPMTNSTNEPVSLQNLNQVSDEAISNSTPISVPELDNANFNMEDNVVESQTDVNASSTQVQLLNSANSQVSEPVMQSLESNNVVNPVTSEFNIAIQNVIEEHTIPTIPNAQEELNNPVVLEFSELTVQNLESNNTVNPVTSEFNNSVSVQSSFISNNSTEPQVSENVTEVNPTEEIKPLDSDKKFDVMGEPTNNGSNLDIFG